MLEMIPKSTFSNCFSFRAPDSSRVELDVSQWRERASFQWNMKIVIAAALVLLLPAPTRP